MWMIQPTVSKNASLPKESFAVTKPRLTLANAVVPMIALVNKKETKSAQISSPKNHYLFSLVHGCQMSVVATRSLKRLTMAKTLMLFLKLYLLNGVYATTRSKDPKELCLVIT